MKAWFKRRRRGPIGVDIGSRAVKLVQFDAQGERLHAASRCEFAQKDDRPWEDRAAEAICLARDGGDFRGREAVFCVDANHLFTRNLRVAPASGRELEGVVRCEVAGRLPFDGEEADIRCVEIDDVRQGAAVRREVIAMACRRTWLGRLLTVVERTGLRAAAIDVEAGAILRCYARQWRGKTDRRRRRMFVGVGSAGTTALIAEGDKLRVLKYLDVGGRRFDEAVARGLSLSIRDAAALRRRNADRPRAERDPDIDRAVSEAMRSAVDRLARELLLCIRYHDVTFRGESVAEAIVGGGEASDTLVDQLSEHLEIPCAMGDPLGPFGVRPSGRAAQWDVAAGLALRRAI